MATRAKQLVAKKRNLVRQYLQSGGSKAGAMRAVKEKFGTGIASRDVGLIAKDLPRDAKRLATLNGAEVERLDRAVGAFVKAVDDMPRAALEPQAKKSSMRRFVLDRSFDATGTSGTGIVAEGVQFSSGHVVIHWLSQLEAINVYGNAMVLEQLHGHNGNTVIQWLDP